MIVNLHLMCNFTTSAGLEVEEVRVLDTESREVAQAVIRAVRHLLERARST